MPSVHQGNKLVMPQKSGDPAPDCEVASRIDTGGKQILTSLDGVTWKSVYVLKAGETFNINGPRLAIAYVLK